MEVMGPDEFNLLADATRRHLGGEPKIGQSGEVIWPIHDWFAWFPVWTPNGGWRWLCKVGRQYTYKRWLLPHDPIVTQYYARAA